MPITTKQNKKMGIVFKNRQMDQGSLVATKSMKIMRQSLDNYSMSYALEQEHKILEAIEKNVPPKNLSYSGLIDYGQRISLLLK